MEEIRDVKCNKCKCYRTKEDFLKSGRQMKTCAFCRKLGRNYLKKYKCIHLKQKSFCRECGGSQICAHNLQKSFCEKCGGSEICFHKKQKSFCVKCGGSEICRHNMEKFYCKICSDPIKVTICQWVRHSRASDKKYNRYDADRFIDKCFLNGLVEDTKGCYYCQKKIQYVNYGDDLATIERLNNSIGHIKSNCVIACLYCNCRHKG